MPKVKDTEALSEGDQTWLGSTRGIRTNRTGNLDVTAFTVDSALGYIPSGTPLAIVGDVYVPYDSAAVAGTGGEVLEGFLFTDQVVDAGQTESINVPVMDHGRVRISRLPVAFARPTPANDHTTVIYDES